MAATNADGRFAPSPTGTLHLGNLRTAVLAWLFARSAGARFVVRMEDLDSGRVIAGAAGRQLEDLRAIGLDWDGEVIFQSARVDAYERAIAKLDLYECFCTRAEIRAAGSAPHAPVGHYPGTCLRLSRSELEAKRASGRAPALRIRTGGGRVTFEDGLAGEVSGVVDDFVVRRGNGGFAYNLAVVVDDAFQRVGKVVRGDDLLDSTPRQVYLARKLDLPVPAYVHVPLVLGPDGSRLAKRHGAVTLAELGVELTRQWIARSLGFERFDDLMSGFDPAAIGREPITWAPGCGPLVR